MPTLFELVDGAYRDLADDKDPRVFSALQVEDFVRGGIVELNRVAPLDSIYTIPWTLDPDSGAITAFAYDIPIELPYRVETLRASDGWATTLPPSDEDSTMTGWTFRRTATGGTIEFPKWWLVDADASGFAIRVHGYRPRDLPYSVDPTDPLASPQTGLSREEEYAVRAYAKSAGFDLLSHDRSLFAQWQGQTNNTDVSQTQIGQMASGAKNEWDRQRGLIRIVRRYQ